MHTVTISRSAATHAERLPIEHGPRRTLWVIGRESSRLHIVQSPLSNIIPRCASETKGAHRDYIA